MSDEIDKANDLAEAERQQAIQNVMRVTGNERLTGYCQWCKEPTRGAFCSATCRNDHTKHERMKWPASSANSTTQ